MKCNVNSSEDIKKWHSLNRWPVAPTLLVALALDIASRKGSLSLHNFCYSIIYEAWEYRIWLTVAVLVLLAIGLPWIGRAAKSVWRISAASDQVPLAMSSFVCMLFALGHAHSIWVHFIGLLGFGVCFFILRHERTIVIADTWDDLHRRYFANRLAEIFGTPGTMVNRVAILGDWGSGKTTVLRLTADRLRKDPRHKFTPIFVNPWKAETVAEAWAMISTAVSQAMGNRPLLTWAWIRHPSLRWLIELFPSPGPFRELLKLLTSSTQFSREALVTRINCDLENHSSKVVVLVDDMERTDPRVLRELFPLIDQVSALKNIAFIFAIDPAQVSRAFAEDARCSPQTKGFLDKVFDLQIQLPQAVTEDMAIMLESEAKRRGAQKLARALPRFRELLPPNPRLALRFLEDAIVKEQIFLARYGTEEIAYTAAFFAWMCEVEFPGILKCLTKPELKRQFATISEVPLFGLSEKKISKHDQFKPLIDSLKTEIGASEGAVLRLGELVEKLAELNGSFVDRLVNPTKQFGIEWAYSGYTRLSELSHPERTRLANRWEREAGTRAINGMILEEFAEDELQFVNPFVCAKQLLEDEVNQIASATRNLHEQPTPYGGNDEEQIITKIRRLRSHQRASRTFQWKADEQLFGEACFKQWLESLADKPLNDDSEPRGSALTRARECFGFYLLKSLPISKVQSFAQWTIDRILEHHGHGRSNERTKVYFEKLKRSLMLRIERHVCIALGEGSDSDQLTQLGKLATDRGIWFLADPRNWTWTESGHLQKLQTRLIRKASTDPRFAESCAEIAFSLFVHPNACDQCAGTHQRDRNEIQALEGKFPGYINAFWESGMKLPADHEGRTRLLRERDRAIARAEKLNDGLTVERLTKLFPVPQNDI